MLKGDTSICYHLHNHCSLQISNLIDQVNFVFDVRIKTYLNPNRFSCMTPSQNCRYNTEEGHCTVGKCATGNLKPPSLRNINCMRCVAISTDEFPIVHTMKNYYKKLKLRYPHCSFTILYLTRFSSYRCKTLPVQPYQSTDDALLSPSFVNLPTCNDWKINCQLFECI